MTPAQQVAVAAELPDAPSIALAHETASDAAFSAAAAAPGGNENGEAMRLSFIPNFRPLKASDHPPALSVKGKFLYATEDNIDIFSVGVPALSAGYRQLTNASPEFGTGPRAYGRYYWHAWVDRASEDYCVEFILPAITREDPRYFSLGRSGGGVWHRAGYAVTRVLVTRRDSGGATFNLSEVAGAGMASGLANLYYPHQERGFEKVGQRWGLNIGFDAAAFLVREFWPDVHDAVFRGSKPMSR
jgi:hypothetical protein